MALANKLGTFMLEKVINKVEDSRNELPTPMYSKLNVGGL